MAARNTYHGEQALEHLPDQRQVVRRNVDDRRRHQRQLALRVRVRLAIGDEKEQDGEKRVECVKRSRTMKKGEPEKRRGDYEVEHDEKRPKEKRGGPRYQK